MEFTLENLVHLTPTAIEDAALVCGPDGCAPVVPEISEEESTD